MPMIICPRNRVTYMALTPAMAGVGRGQSPYIYIHAHTSNNPGDVSTSPGRCQQMSQKALAGVSRCLQTFWQVLAPSMIWSSWWQKEIRALHFSMIESIGKLHDLT